MASARVMWRRTRILGGIALALALLILTAWLLAINWAPDRKAFPIQGIDISEAQGGSGARIDWFQVRALNNIQFAYARATIGAKGRDRRFRRHWQGLYAAGIPRGAIHLFSLCQLAADQAANLIAFVPHQTDQLPIALDLDFRPDCAARPERHVVLGEINRFIIGVEAAMHKRVILRITPEFEARYRVSSAIARRLWAVRAFFPPDYFDKPWTMWQASSFRRVAGISAAVNWNVMVK